MSPKTALRTIGIILIVFGCIFCIVLIVFQYLHCVETWNSEFKFHTFSSVTEYFFSVSKGAILIAVLGGSVSVIAGSALLKRTNS